MPAVIIQHFDSDGKFIQLFEGTFDQKEKVFPLTIKFPKDLIIFAKETVKINVEGVTTTVDK